MTQTRQAAPPTTTPEQRQADLVVHASGEPAYVLLEYDLHLLLNELIAELRKAQRSDLPPSHWDAVRQALRLVEGMIASTRISAEIDTDPSTLVSHAELKRRLAEKKAALERQHVAA